IAVPTRRRLSLAGVKPARTLAGAATCRVHPSRSIANVALLPVVDTEGAAENALAPVLAVTLMASLVDRRDPMIVGAAARADGYGLGFRGVHAGPRLHCRAPRRPAVRPRDVAAQKKPRREAGAMRAASAAEATSSASAGRPCRATHDARPARTPRS